MDDVLALLFIFFLCAVAFSMFRDADREDSGDPPDDDTPDG